MKLLKRPHLDHPRCGAVQLAWFAASLILQAIASTLLNKKEKSPLDDDKPTVLATRGSPVNWLVGRRMVGEVFAWAGARSVESEPIDGGKALGGGSPEQDVFSEERWPLLCVGQPLASH